MAGYNAERFRKDALAGVIVGIVALPLAMAFAIAALGARGPSRIEGSDVVAISYPGFFDTLQRLVV